MKILDIQNLCIKNNEKTIIENLDLSIENDKINVLIGSSGSGKTQIAKSIMKLSELDIQGVIKIKGNEDYKCGKDVALIFQDFARSLNPVLKIKDQMLGPLIYHNIYDEKTALKKIEDMLLKLNLNLDILEKYPHELSGGQKQRIVIGIVLLLQPKIIICDEISSGLDKENENYIFDLLKKTNITLLVITHSINVLKNYSYKIIYLYNGKLKFVGTYKEFLNIDDQYISNIKKLGEIYDKGC